MGVTASLSDSSLWPELSDTEIEPTGIPRLHGVCACSQCVCVVLPKPDCTKPGKSKFYTREGDAIKRLGKQKL